MDPPQAADERNRLAPEEEMMDEADRTAMTQTERSDRLVSGPPTASVESDAPPYSPIDSDSPRSPIDLDRVSTATGSVSHS